MNLNNQNFLSRDSICSEILDGQDDLKELLLENSFLKEQIENLRKKQENLIFEYENKIKNYERDIIKLKSSLNSANEMIEVYKEIDKQKENSEIKDILQKLKSRNTEIEQINLLLKKENSEMSSELENLKLKFKAYNYKNYNNLKDDAETKENEQPINNFYNHKNFNSICSTNQGSSINMNLHNQLSNETITFNGKVDNYINKTNLCPTLSNISFENKDNAENDKSSRKNTIKETNTDKMNDNEQNLNEFGNEMDESASFSSDISFSSKNPQQIKDIFLKIRKEKDIIYDNAVELMTENEIEIKTLKNDNEDLKYILSRYEEELMKIKSYLKEKYNIDLEKNENFNNGEKSLEIIENYISVYNRDQNVNTENSLKKIIKAIGINNDNNIENEETVKNLNTNMGSIKDFRLNNEVTKPNREIQNVDKNNIINNIPEDIKIKSEKNSPKKISKTEDEKFFSSEKYNNSFEQDKNELRNLIETLESKLFESSKNYEDKITKLKLDLENMELEKNQYQQELENIQNNKKNLVEDIEFYSDTVRSLQDQKEKLEDNLKNKIDFLLTDNKSLEQTIMKISDQLLLLEKENKELKEKEAKRFKELKENFSKEKDVFDSKFKELTNRYLECNKEKEFLKKENENSKQIVDRKKCEIDELIEKKLRSKEKKENELKTLNENYKKHIEKLQTVYDDKINKYQEKIKSLYNVIDKYIQKINSMTKNSNNDTVKRSKSTILSKDDFSNIKWARNQVNINLNELKNNFNYIQRDSDLHLSSGKINESPMEYEKQFSDYETNEKFDREMSSNINIEINDNLISDANIKKDTTLSPIEDYKSNDQSEKSKEYDLSSSPVEKKIKFLDLENRLDSEFIDLYGFDPKKRHNSYIKSLNSNNFHSEISSNSIINSYLNESTINVPLAFALKDENSTHNKMIDEKNDNRSKRRKSNINFIRRKSTMNIFKKISKENIKIKLKRKKSRKIFTEKLPHFNKDVSQEESEMKYNENMKVKFDLILLKKAHEQELNNLNNKIYELKDIIKKLQEQSQDIDNMLVINDLKGKIMIMTQENINLKDEIKIIKADLETLEETKNQYIQKLKKDVEKAEEEEAKSRFSMGQINFEKDSEILKYRNYCKKLKITIKSLEDNNRILSENINNLNSRKSISKN